MRYFSCASFILISFLQLSTYAENLSQNNLSDSTSPKVLKSQTNSLDDIEKLFQVLEESVGANHPDAHEKFNIYLKNQKIDPENDEKTLFRLRRNYITSIHNWGDQFRQCESGRTSNRWYRRMKRKFGEDEISKHKKEITKLITGLYLKRKNECMQEFEESALRAERELEAFSTERLRLILKFLNTDPIEKFDENKILQAYKNRPKSQTLSRRVVDINALRLETKLQNLPSELNDFINHELSFKKPFDLEKNLSFLDEDNLNKSLPAKKLDFKPLLPPKLIDTSNTQKISSP